MAAANRLHHAMIAGAVVTFDVLQGMPAYVREDLEQLRTVAAEMAQADAERDRKRRERHAKRGW